MSGPILVPLCENVDCTMHSMKIPPSAVETHRAANRLTIYQGRNLELRLCANCTHAADTYHAFLKRVQVKLT